MASNGATGSITDRVTQILTAFEAIDTVETREEPGESQLTWLQTISDQLSKFKLWAGNIGAHRTGRSSLDYRLRDSSHLQIQVMRLLDDLITSLNEVHSILSGETIPWDQDSGEVDDLDDELKDLLMNEDFEFDSELSQLTKEIADAIGNLLRLSISLRNPAPHDRFMSTEYAKARYFEANDKALTEAKFPRASQTLVTRLGQALSQRRQYFRYRESHHEKLAHGLFNSGRSEAGAQSEIASSIPQAMKDPGAAPTFRGLDEDERSDTGFSQTSFATTAPDSGSLRIPPLPKKTLDGPFECPFCFMSISVSSTHQWKKHVFADLRPYVCLAEDCPVASREYGRRHEWMNHTLQNHWKTWECPYQCGSEHTTETGLRQHVTGIHGCATEMELDAMIARYGRIRSISTSSPVECPLCKDTLESIQQYQRHVGRHQVDLALFALPKIDNDDDDELDEEIEDQGTITSGSYSEALSQDIPPTALAEATETIDESTLVDNMTPPQPNLPARSEVPRFSKYNVNPDYSEAGERVRFTLAHYNKRNFGPEMYYPDETTASVTGEREQGARTREFEQLDVLKNISTDSKDERVHTKGHEYTNEPFINIKAIRPLSGEELSLPIQTTELPTPSPSTSKRVVDDRGTLSDYKPESTQRYPAEMTKAMLVEKEAREPETLEHLSDVPLMTYTSPMTLDKDWENISDLAERRRIQNRIAQRNYRKKLKKRLEELEDRAERSSEPLQQLEEIVNRDSSTMPLLEQDLTSGGRSSAGSEGAPAVGGHEEEANTISKGKNIESEIPPSTSHGDTQLPQDQREGGEIPGPSTLASSGQKVVANEQCEICGYRPQGKPENAKAYMRKHKKAKHPTNPPVMCPFPGCAAKFTRQDNLRVHQIKNNHFVGDKAPSMTQRGEIDNEKEAARPPLEAELRPTYTRMSRRHLSLETLRVYHVDYNLDTDPEYILIKQWVSEPEQDILWRHTRVIREQRAAGSVIPNEKPRPEPEFEWGSSKEHKRSKSPSLLRYLAGGRPS